MQRVPRWPVRWPVNQTLAGEIPIQCPPTLPVKSIVSVEFVPKLLDRPVVKVDECPLEMMVWQDAQFFERWLKAYVWRVTVSRAVEANPREHVWRAVRTVRGLFELAMQRSLHHAFILVRPWSAWAVHAGYAYAIIRRRVWLRIPLFRCTPPKFCLIIQESSLSSGRTHPDLLSRRPWTRGCRPEDRYLIA